jgi:ribosomal protein L37AE/L43A
MDRLDSASLPSMLLAVERSMKLARIRPESCPSCHNRRITFRHMSGETPYWYCRECDHKWSSPALKELLS